MLYECVGDAKCGLPLRGDCRCQHTNRLAIYYGAADTVVALAFCRIDELVAYIKENAV